ncbi:MAG: hypothetical protein ACLTT1_01810 [[Clostridium] scindens]
MRQTVASCAAGPSGGGESKRVIIYCGWSTWQSCSTSAANVEQTPSSLILLSQQPTFAAVGLSTGYTPGFRRPMECWKWMCMAGKSQNGRKAMTLKVD